MARGNYQGNERRQYIRLDTVFPVEFYLMSCDRIHFLSSWRQGFTNNISLGGICLTVNNLDKETIGLLEEKETRLSLNINTPIFRKSISAFAKVVWIEKLRDLPTNQYLIGLGYEEIKDSDNRKIIHYANFRRYAPRVTIALILILVFSFGLISYFHASLLRKNKALVHDMVDVLQKATLAREEIKEINKEKGSLEKKLNEANINITYLEGTLKEKTEEFQRKIKQEISGLEKEKLELEERLARLQDREAAVNQDLISIKEKGAFLEKVNLEKMYLWLKTHQNPHTGLVVSFEGDSRLNDWAFTYDQSLVACVYTFFGDYENSRKIFDFYLQKAKKVKNGFVNAYYTRDGGVAEYAVHSGPNSWLGIAVMQYIARTGDQHYLPLAREIADWLLSIQDQDPDGGIRGGPDVFWFSTEHNLDVYAFFNMLNLLTQDKKYSLAAERVLHWLNLHTYDRPNLPIKRGKGDATIATDTYAWAIAAIGPERLIAQGMDADEIVAFAEDACAVKTEFSRPNGEVIEVKGFDFAPSQHVARGGVISSEWTAQMIIAYRIMADFYEKKGVSSKARFYQDRAEEYLPELGKLIISSPSPTGQGEGCLPYATQGTVDTGHGWITPKGNSTGSVSATTYAIFAYYNYNPLKLAPVK